MTAKKKDKKKDDKKVVRDSRNIETLLPIPRPTVTNEEIRKEVKALAEDTKKRQLEYAAKIKTWAKPGELCVGWRFPKEDQIHSMWAEWEKLYESQPDIVNSIQASFEKAGQRRKAQREAELKEMEGSS